MEVEKIKDIDKPQEFNEKEKPEITPEMKYIKWPKKGKVTREMVSVLLSSIAVSMLIAAGDQTGMHLLDAVMKIFWWGNSKSCKNAALFCNWNICIAVGFYYHFNLCILLHEVFKTKKEKKGICIYGKNV